METYRAKSAEAGGLLSVAEVAEALGVTTATVRRWINAGLVAATKLGPHATSPLRVPRVSLERLLRENIVVPHPAKRPAGLEDDEYEYDEEPPIYDDIEEVRAWLRQSLARPERGDRESEREVAT